jgi:hypothetical protein
VTKRNEPNPKPAFLTIDYWKAVPVKVRDKLVEDTLAKVVTWGGIGLLAVVGTSLGFSCAIRDYPPAYNENAAQNPDGPFHFMPMIQYARTNLGYEVQFDPIIEDNTVSITYPEALSVHKIRGDVFDEFQRKYPHCLTFERETIQSSTDDQDTKEVVTIRLNQLTGPIQQIDDPRLLYRCEKVEQ